MHGGEGLGLILLTFDLSLAFHLSFVLFFFYFILAHLHLSFFFFFFSFVVGCPCQALFTHLLCFVIGNLVVLGPLFCTCLFHFCPFAITSWFSPSSFCMLATSLSIFVFELFKQFQYRSHTLAFQFTNFVDRHKLQINFLYLFPIP